MQGYVVDRKAGWDCHGLPVEREVEKMLDLHTFADVQEFGQSKFNALCEQSVWKFEGEWENFTRRMGYWVDMKNRYATLDQDYMESEWWALKQLWGKGLLKRGYKVLPYSPHTGCTYSNRDVSEGYRTVTDLTCFVKFPLLDDKSVGDDAPKTSLVAWTSTPWTLPANVLLAVNKSLVYVSVMVTTDRPTEMSDADNWDGRKEFEVGKAYLQEGEVLVVAKDRLEELETHLPSDSGYQLVVVTEFQGYDLLDLQYKPPLKDQRAVDNPKTSLDCNLWRVVHADFVNSLAGTGVVHVSPMYGEDDFKLCEGLGLDFSQRGCSHVVGLDGCYNREGDKLVPPGPLRGLDVTKQTTQQSVLNLLHQRGFLHRAHEMTHEYPYCWRNKENRLLYYAMESWFLTVGMPEVRSRLQKMNASESVQFSPGSVKHGRFGKWLEHTNDWCVSRKRTWGCPFPLWECRSDKGGCGRQHCVGSRAELRSLLLDPEDQPLEDNTDLHSTQVDEYKLKCPYCGSTKSMLRKPYVLDCWFDSGCAPFAQWHYPFAFSETHGKSVAKAPLGSRATERRALHLTSTSTLDSSRLNLNILRIRLGSL